MIQIAPEQAATLRALLTSLDAALTSDDWLAVNLHMLAEHGVSDPPAALRDAALALAAPGLEG